MVNKTKLPNLNQIDDLETDIHWTCQENVADDDQIIDRICITTYDLYMVVQFMDGYGDTIKTEVSNVVYGTFEKEENAADITKLLSIVSANESRSRWNLRLETDGLTDKHLEYMRIYVQKHNVFFRKLSISADMTEVTGDCMFKLMLASGCKQLIIDQCQIVPEFFSENLKMWIKYESRTFTYYGLFGLEFVGGINPVDLLVEDRTCAFKFNDSVLTQEIVDALVEKRISMGRRFSTFIDFYTEFKPTILRENTEIWHREDGWSYHIRDDESIPGPHRISIC